MCVETGYFVAYLLTESAYHTYAEEHDGYGERGGDDCHPERRRLFGAGARKGQSACYVE